MLGRVLIALAMGAGTLLSWRGLLSLRQLERYAFWMGVVCVAWISALMHYNRLYLTYVIAGYITIAIFPFIFSEVRYIRWLLASALLVMPAAILTAPAPLLAPGAVGSLSALLILSMYLISIRLLTWRQKLLRNQSELARQLAELSALSERLQVAEERLSYAIESNRDGVLDWDVPKNHMYFSPSWHKLFGYSEQTAPTTPEGLFALIHRSDQAFIAQKIALVLNGETEDLRDEFRLRAADGSWRHVRGRGRVVSRSPDGKPLRLVGTHSDVSAEVQARERIRQEERRNQALIQALPDIIFQLDAQGFFTGFKADNAERLLIPAAEIIGKHLREIPFPGEVLQQLEEKLQHTLQTGALEIMEYAVPAKGQALYCEARLVKISEQEIVCVVRDITDRVLRESALVEAKEKAEAAAQARAQFLSMMSHEIRTPMNGVIGITHLLLQEDPRPDQLEHLHTLRFAGENLLVIINDILDYSKIESGKLSFEALPISLNELGVLVFKSLQQKAAEKQLPLSLFLDPGLPPTVLGDPTRLSQILTNLLNNAIKFTERGQVEMRLRPGQIGEAQAEVHFEVSDTGIGIPADKLGSIFESFTQASADHTRKYGGTGLGLSICKRLIELQGGRLQVESEVGKGSRFFFTLSFPLLREAGGLRPELLKPRLELGDYESLGQMRVLLVEDNPVNLKIVLRFLHKWDAQADVAENGQIALDKAAAQPYALILMDLQMPVMGGYEAARLLRQSGGPNAQTPIIALTANVMQEVSTEVLAAGMDDFVSKPFNPQELYRKLRKYQPLSSRPPKT
jgi:PAS domain S-box-containing protein